MRDGSDDDDADEEDYHHDDPYEDKYLKRYVNIEHACIK
jgi:hypothetical protein